MLVPRELDAGSRPCDRSAHGACSSGSSMPREARNDRMPSSGSLPCEVDAVVVDGVERDEGLARGARALAAGSGRTAASRPRRAASRSGSARRRGRTDRRARAAAARAWSARAGGSPRMKVSTAWAKPSSSLERRDVAGDALDLGARRCPWRCRGRRRSASARRWACRRWSRSARGGSAGGARPRARPCPCSPRGA